LIAVLELAMSKREVVVVLTVADVTEVCSGETEQVQQKLVEAKRASARQEQVRTLASLKSNRMMNYGMVHAMPPREFVRYSLRNRRKSLS
jgi:hypothetical protein